MHKPTTGPSRAHPRTTTGDAGPLDGNPAPLATEPRPATRAGGAGATSARTPVASPRSETAVYRTASLRRDGARPAGDRRALPGSMAGRIALLDLKPAGYRAALTGLGRTVIRQDRSIAFLVAALVLLAVVAAAIPASSSAAGDYQLAAVGQTDGAGSAARMPVGQGTGAGDGAGPVGPGEVSAAEAAGIDAGTLSADGGAAPAGAEASTLAAGTDPGTDQGAFLPDGTLLKPIAVDTTLPDTKTVTRTYRVKPGDTLSKIATKFGLNNMMSIWWANHLKSKSLKPGMKLIIPTDDGLLVKVKEGDSLDRIARTYDVDPAKIQEANGLADEVVYIGQTLFVPGGQGAPVATPKPKPKPNPIAGTPGNPSTGGGLVGGGPVGPVHYGGGRMSWPVVGGGNYVSQYFHYGHPALDIAGSYGAAVVAAAGGRVIFAGWRSNGGGYQVWIDHGNGIYTTYNHLAGVSVGSGQTVGAGQRIGSLGASGWATGPHLHFEVWSGYPWSGGTRINPLAYVR